MTIINALEILKARGITSLTGMYNLSDIDAYIAHAKESHETSVKYSDVPCHMYSLDREDKHYIAEINGHHIIVSTYESGTGGTFDMATYGDYETEEEMRADFEEWQIQRKAETMADEMIVERPGELPRAAWFMIAISELREASKAAKIAFERDFPAEAAI